MASGKLTQPQLAQALRERFENQDSHFYKYEQIDSTMNVAKKLIMDGLAQHGDVLVADIQTGGRGRRGRAWASPAGGLWSSFILCPEVEADSLPLLTLQAAVAVTKAIREQTSLLATIKWPNDIQIHGRKVCGIALDLVRTGNKNFIVLGIGINTNLALTQLEAEVRRIATTLLEEVGSEIDSNLLLLGIVEHLVEGLAELKNGSECLLASWRDLNNTLGKAVRVVPADGSEPYQGRALAIAKDGSLIVESQTGIQHHVKAGDVSIRF